MKTTITSTLKFESEIRTETYSTNQDLDNENFVISDIIISICESIKKCFPNIDDEKIIKILECNLEFYEKKLELEHEENYPSMLRNKPNSN